jgi:hypothetical protein
MCLIAAYGFKGSDIVYETVEKNDQRILIQNASNQLSIYQLIKIQFSEIFNIGGS